MDLKEIGKVDPDNFWYYLYKGHFIFDKAIKSFNKSEILLISEQVLDISHPFLLKTKKRVKPIA